MLSQLSFNQIKNEHIFMDFSFPTSSFAIKKKILYALFSFFMNRMKERIIKKKKEYLILCVPPYIFALVFDPLPTHQNSFILFKKDNTKIHTHTFLYIKLQEPVSSQKIWISFVLCEEKHFFFKKKENKKLKYVVK